MLLDPDDHELVRLELGGKPTTMLRIPLSMSFWVVVSVVVQFPEAGEKPAVSRRA
jgi:hypothetical protein